jgi:hypothetical protein
MIFIVYKITNVNDGKFYIGKHQTDNIDDDYFGSGKLLKRAIAKYGKDNFRKEILFQFKTEEEMNTKEKELVTEEFCKRKDTYNICPGGQGGFGYINRSNLNYKFTRSDVEKAVKRKQELIELGIFKTNKGMKHSPEARLKMSLKRRERELRK